MEQRFDLPTNEIILEFCGSSNWSRASFWDILISKLSISSDTLQLKGVADTANGDILYGANGSSGGYSALSIGTYDSTHSVGQILQVGASSTVAWSNTLDGGTF